MKGRECVTMQCPVRSNIEDGKTPSSSLRNSIIQSNGLRSTFLFILPYSDDAIHNISKTSVTLSPVFAEVKRVSDHVLEVCRLVRKRRWVVTCHNVATDAT